MNRSLVFDIETYAPGDSPDPEVDHLRYVGFRLPNGRKFTFHYSNKQAIQNMLSSYPILVGHNIKTRKYKTMSMGYDVRVMERHGFEFKTHSGKRHILVDTQEIIEKRAKSMMYLDFGRGQLNLRYLANYFNLEVKKGEFDFHKLKAQRLTGDDYRELVEYLEGDLDTTFYLYKHLYDFFSGFMELMSPKDIHSMKWLTASSGSTAYKIICFQATLPELYRDYEECKKLKTVKYTGGYVALPKQDYVEGVIREVDFASLYPNMFMGGNLYSPAEEGWTGGEIYGEGPDAIKGTYSRTPGKIESVIQTLFLTRQEIKSVMKQMKREGRQDTEEYAHLDRKQLAIKICINTMYGISGSPKFVSVYNITTASDCTAMARTSEKHAGRTLEKHGYKLLYGDTDSWYILDPFKDEDRLKNLCKAISKKQTTSFNVPTKTHDFELGDKIKRMWFFRGDDGKFIKKHYMYEKEDGTIVKKGIRLVKGDCSEISRLVYKERLESHLRDAGEDFYLPPQLLLEWVKDVSEGNYGLLTKRYRVRSLTSYKSTTSIQAQIAFRYGPGEHYLVPNYAVGAGKSKRYAQIEELRKAFGDKWIDVVDYTTFLGDLKNFVNPRDRKILMKLK